MCACVYISTVYRKILSIKVSDSVHYLLMNNIQQVIYLTIYVNN